MNINRNILLLFFIAFTACSGKSQTNWQLVWSDEFNGTTLNIDLWTPVNAGTGFGNQEKQYYSSRPQNLRVENGNLVINALLENYTVGSASWKYTSAKVSTQNKKDIKYGKIEARLKLPKGQGTWPAFWTLGYGGWPSCGEIDICEFQGSQPNQFQTNIHTKNYNGTNGTNWHLIKPVPTVSDSFHVYTIEWTDVKIKFYFDGAQYWSFAAASVLPVDYPFNNPIYLILNLAIGGTMGGWVDDTIFPQQMLVDYVRVYQDASLGLNDPVSKDNPIIPSFISDKISIQFPTNYTSTKSINVYDINGRTLLTKQTTENKIDIESGSFSKGMYLVKVNAGDRTFTQKVIKK